MTWGLRVHSADYEPRELYELGELAPESPDLVTPMVRFGDAPLALLVDMSGERTRILWSFKGKRGETNRIEYFIADFVTDEVEPFKAFARGLEAMHADDWIIPQTGVAEWDLGFDLWRVPQVTAGPEDSPIERLGDRVPLGDAENGPICEEMPDVRTALGAIRALESNGTRCRVGLGREGDPGVIPGLDVLFLPTGEPSGSRNGSVRNSSGGGSVSSRSVRQRHRSAISQGAGGALSRAGQVGASIASGLGVIATISWFNPTRRSLELMTPRIALATVAGILGAAVAFVILGWWLTPRRLMAPSRMGPETADDDLAIRRFNPSWAAVWLGYGAVWGMLFPIMFFLGHKITDIGRTWYLFDDIVTLRGALPSMTVYLAGLYVFTIGAVSVVAWATEEGWDAIDVKVLWGLGLAHLLYGGVIVLVLTWIGVG